MEERFQNSPDATERNFTIKIYNWNEVDDAARKRLMERSQLAISEIRESVVEIVSDVRQNGDQALLAYTRRFDNPSFEIEQLRVSTADIEQAYKSVDPVVCDTIKQQIAISRAYAQKERDSIVMDWQVETIPGVITGLRYIPLESVGLYVPATKAPLPVVAQILAVTAEAAKVSRKVVCFPPTGEHFEIIISAVEAGADEIYRMGGPQAIAALAYGTQSISPVDFIAGPGSLYVQAAKLEVFGKVGIDMISGPSEVLILADSNANPAYLAADILARCEHGPDSAAIMLTDSKEIAALTQAEIIKQASQLPRQEYISAALSQFSSIILVQSTDQMIEFAHKYAPEHLEVHLETPQEFLPRLKNAGSIFLGPFAPVAVGDYASGTNHCLPTGSAARFASPVGVRMFLKASAYQELTKEGLLRLKDIVETLAGVEGLTAHKKSVTMRFAQED